MRVVSDGEAADIRAAAAKAKADAEEAAKKNLANATSDDDGGDGKVLKDRRSPRERGRMGTSVRRARGADGRSPFFFLGENDDTT